MFGDTTFPLKAIRQMIIKLDLFSASPKLLSHESHKIMYHLRQVMEIFKGESLMLDITQHC